MAIYENSAAYEIFRGIYKAGSQSENGSCSVLKESAQIAQDSDNRSAITIALEDYTDKLNSLHGEDYSNLTVEDTKQSFISSIASLFGLGETNVFETEAGQQAVEEAGNYDQENIYTEANNLSGGIMYSKSYDSFAESALTFAKADIEAVEEAYQIAYGKDYNDGKLGAAEINSYNYNDITYTNIYIDNVDLDGKGGINAKEYASYMLLADGLVVDGDEISFDPDSMDGLITEEEAQAVADAENDKLQELALEIYEQYYK